LHRQAGPDGASVRPLQGHLPPLYADGGVGRGLNFLRSLQVSTVRAVSHAETGKVPGTTRQEAVGHQPGVEEVRYRVDALVRRAPKRPEYAQVPLLGRVAPARESLIGHGVEPIAGLHCLPRPACQSRVEDFGAAAIEVRPEFHVARQTGGVVAVIPAIAELADD